MPTPVLAPVLVLDLILCLLVYHHVTMMMMMYEDKNDDVMMTMMMMVVIVVVFVVIRIDFYEGHCCDRDNPDRLIVLPVVHVVLKMLVVVAAAAAMTVLVLALVLVCGYPRKKEHDDRVPNAPYHAQEMMKMGT